MAAGNKKSYKNNTSKNGTSKNAASKKTVAKNSSKGGSNNRTSAKKNTASKKTSARSKAAIERKAREEELARQKQMRSEIILIVLFAFSVFLLLANFRICGIVGDTVSGFFFGIIGFSEYIFPVYLFVSAAYLISNDFRGKIVKKVVYFGVVLILLSMVFQAIYSSTFESVKVLYMDGYKDRSGGGVICGGIFFAIRTLLGVPGACIVIFIAAVIMFILITEISVIDEIKLFIASIRERRESDDDEQYEDEEYQSDRYDDGYYSHDVNDTPVRRVRPSMANLNVYSSDKSKDDRASDRTAATQVKPRKTKIQKDVEREPARDFFAMEDVHELTPGDGAVDMSYDEFNNDIEKIVMTDREEIVNPVQIDREDPVHKPVRKPAPVKRRKPVVVTPEEPKLAAVDTDMDVIALHQAGFTNAVASLGTAFTSQQSSLLKRYTDTVYLCYDSDGAGVKAALRAIPMLKEAGITVKVINMRPYKYPDEFIKALSKEEFQKRIDQAQNSFFYEIDRLRTAYNMEDPEEKTRFMNEAEKKCLTFDNEIERNNYIEAFARQYAIRAEDFRGLVSRQAAARVGIDYEKIRQERRQKSKTQKEDGILKIQGVLLTWIAEDVGLFPKISRWLQPDDFFEEPYHTIAGMLYEQARTGEISPAQIISYFESKEEQSLAAGIFNKQVQQVNEDSEREKALNEMVKTLKKASLDKKSREITDLSQLQKIIMEKKQLETLHITLT